MKIQLAESTPPKQITLTIRKLRALTCTCKLYILTLFRVNKIIQFTFRIKIKFLDCRLGAKRFH